MDEEWRDIPGNPGYQASSAGQIRSPKGIIKQNPIQCRFNVYYKAGVGRNKKGHCRKLFVHRLVCLTFHGPHPEGMKQVRHLDGNPANNAASNLRWGNQSMNEYDKKNCLCGRPCDEHNEDGQPVTPGVPCSGYKTKEDA